MSQQENMTYHPGIIQKKFSKRKLRKDSETEEYDIPSKKKLLDNLSMPGEGLKSTEHGNIFQLKLLMLCLWQAAHTKENNEMKFKEFRLATEMPKAEKFDDIVFQYLDNNSKKWKFRLLQAKHKEGINKDSQITLNDLLSTNNDEEFSLQKYFHSFLKIQQRSTENSVYSVFSDSEIEDISLITNTDFNSALKEKNLFFEDKKNIKKDALFKTDKKNTKIWKINEKNDIVNEMKLIFENTSDFYKLVESLADCITQNNRIEKNNIYKEYYYPLINEVFEIVSEVKDDDKKFYIILNNFIEKKNVCGENLSQEGLNIRTALVKEMAFRKGEVLIPEIHPDFGFTNLPSNHEELKKLANKVAHFIKMKKKFTVHDFEEYHVALANEIISIKKKKLKSKFCQVSVNPRFKRELSIISKFKVYFKGALGDKKTNNYLKNLSFDLSDNFGKSNLFSDENKLNKLADKLADKILLKKKLDLNEFQNVHAILSKEVIDVKARKFHKIFIDGKLKVGDEVRELSSQVKKLRRFLLDKIFEKNVIITIKGDETTLKQLENNFILLKKLFNENELLVSNGFNNKFKLLKNPDFEDIDLFVEQIVKLIHFYKNEKVIEINDKLKTVLSLNDEALKIFNNNIKKLAGYVLINRFNKICFSTVFLHFDKILLSNLKKFRNKIKESLNTDKFEFLYEYEFKFDDSFKFNTCEDGELYKKLPIIHTNQDIKNFFQKLKFIVNYLNRTEMSVLLGTLINDEFKRLDSKFYESRYYKYIHDWMANRVGTFYTFDKAKKVFQEIDDGLSLIEIDSSNQTYFAKFSQMYQFKKYDIFDKFLLSKKQVLEIIYKDISLGCYRIVQALEALHAQDVLLTRKYTRKFGYIFTSLEKLNFDHDFKSDLAKVLKDESNFNLIIIECNVEKPAAFYENLSRILKHSNQKKIIFISTKQNKILPKIFLINYTKKIDESSYNDLIEDSQKQLLKYPVFFQGEEVSLDKLLNESIQNAKNVIDTETLIMILNNKQINIGTTLNDLSGIRGCYADRMFNKQVKIQKNDFRKNFQKENSSSDYVIISGKINDKFKSLKNCYVFDDKSKINEEAVNKFEELRIKYPKSNIHWLQNLSSKGLIWNKSYGSISKLVPYRARKSIPQIDGTFVKEKKLVDENGAVIISDIAGMGKSTVLTSLSIKLKKKYPNWWVIRINLNDYTAVFDNVLKNKEYYTPQFFDKPENIINFLLKDLLASREYSKLETKFEEALFIYNFKKIIWLFDGIDEISPDYKEIIINLLQSLKSFGVEKIFLTTRPNIEVAEELENIFQVFSCKLKPISKTNQIKFLYNYWAKNLKVNIKSKDQTSRLNKYANFIINKLSKQIYDEQSRFVGIILHTQMLAEVFQYNYERTNAKWQGCKEFLESNRSEPLMFTNFNIFFFYDRFIEKKVYEYYLEDKRGYDRTKVNARSKATEEYEDSMKEHELLACCELFNKNQLKELLTIEEVENLKASIKKIKNLENKCGIVNEIINDRPQFIHRTFAEYFVSKRIHCCFSFKQIPPLIFIKVLIEGNYPSLQDFFDQKLNDEPIDKWNEVFPICIKKTYTFDYNFLKKISNLLLRVKYCNILVFEFYKQNYHLYKEFVRNENNETIKITLDVLEVENYTVREDLWKSFLNDKKLSEVKILIHELLDKLGKKALQTPLRDFCDRHMSYDSSLTHEFFDKNKNFQITNLIKELRELFLDPYNSTDTSETETISENESFNPIENAKKKI